MRYRIIEKDKKIPIESILELWSSNLSIFNTNRFQWFYNDNPVDEPATWLAIHNETEDIVGCASLYPRMFQVFNEEIKIGIACDFAVDKKHRVFGPAVIMQKQLLSDHSNKGFNFIFGCPNSDSEKVFLRAGNHLLGNATSWVKLLKTRFKIKKYIKNKIFLTTVCFFADLFLLLLDKMICLNVSTKYSIEILKKFDERFNTLWSTAKDNYNITGVREYKFLNWRYIESKSDTYNIFCITQKNQKTLAGYIVYTVKNNIAEIGDIIALDQGKILKLLIYSFIKEMRKQSMDAVLISFFGKDSFLSILKKFCFIKRPFNRAVIVGFNKSFPTSLIKKIKDKENWFVLDGDLDV